MKPVQITYQLEFAEFSDFNNLLAAQIIKGSKKKITICGILEAIFACGLMFYNFIWGDNQKMLFILSIALFCVGMFCIMFYPLFFEKSLNASILKEYNENPYFANNTTLSFMEDGIKETNKLGKGFTEYEQMGESFFYNDMLIIKLGNSNGFAIPKRVMDQETEQAVIEILKEKCGDLAKF